MRKKCINMAFILIIWIIAGFILLVIIGRICPEEEDLFTLCDNIMYGIAHITGLSYEESCVYFNLWGESILCVITSLLIFIPNILRYIKHDYSWRNILSTICMILYVVWICYYSYLTVEPYYRLPIEGQFVCSVQNILYMTDKSQEQYVTSNLITYVVVSFTILCFNVLFYFENREFVKEVNNIKKESHDGTN